VDINTEKESAEYEAPIVVDYGSLRELTAGLNHGTALDASFPAHTQLSDLTFSTPL
jgi:hypothetical protein